MLQPIDYASAFQQQGGLLGPVSQGLQLGAQFANIDQLRALRETQANELEFKRAQAEQNAAAAASRQQRIDSIMASIQQKRQSGDLTQLDIDEAMVALPKDIADAYKNYGKSFSEEKQNYMRRVLMPIVLGKMNQERLVSYLDTESSAAERSGMKEEAQNIKKIRDMVSSGEQTPEGLADSTVMAVGVFPWAKDIVETYNTGKREARAAAGESRAERKFPAELKKLETEAGPVMVVSSDQDKKKYGLVDNRNSPLQGTWAIEPGKTPKRIDETPPLVKVDVGQPGAPQKEETEFEKNLAKQASAIVSEWRFGGGSANAAARISQLNAVVKALDKDPNLTGPWTKAVPDWAMPFLKPSTSAARQNAERVIQEGLRAILGAQFTKEEGERFLARSFDPALGTKENARRLRLITQQMKESAKQAESMSRYAEDNRSLVGYKGPIPSLADFDKALGADVEQEKQTSGPASGSPPAKAQRNITVDY
jgi:hypothetical protein